MKNTVRVSYQYYHCHLALLHNYELSNNFVYKAFIRIVMYKISSNASLHSSKSIPVSPCTHMCYSVCLSVCVCEYW